MAEWEYVTERDEYVIFSDPDFLEVKGNIARDWAKNWFLTDYFLGKEIGDIKFMSKNSRHEFNCNDKTWRTTYLVAYSKAMGQGDIVKTVDWSDNEFIPVIPGSIGNTLFDDSCK